MLILKGKLLHIFTSADYTNKETGEVTQGKVKLQLLVQTPLRNGEVKNELIDISIPKENYEQYKSKIGSTVEVPIGIITKGKITYYGV